MYLHVCFDSEGLRLLYDCIVAPLQATVFAKKHCSMSANKEIESFWSEAAVKACVNYWHCAVMDAASIPRENDRVLYLTTSVAIKNGHPLAC